MSSLSKDAEGVKGHIKDRQLKSCQPAFPRDVCPQSMGLTTKNIEVFGPVCHLHTQSELFGVQGLTFKGRRLLIFLTLLMSPEA